MSKLPRRQRVGMRPTASYGISAMAWPTARLRRWRGQLAAVTVGGGAGRSQALAWSLSRCPHYDPWYEHALRPIVAWAKGLQTATSALGKRALGSASAAAREVLDSKGQEALAGRGPAAAASGGAQGRGPAASNGTTQYKGGAPLG